MILIIQIMVKLEQLMIININKMVVHHHQILHQYHHDINLNEHVQKQKKLIVQQMKVFGYKNNIIMH